MGQTKSAIPPCRVELVTSDAGFDALEVEWRSLYARVAHPPVPLRWEWMRNWWRIFGPIYGASPGGLRILVTRQGDDLIGILPLYLRAGRGLRPSRLGFISTGESLGEVVYPEYLDILALPEFSERCLALFTREIFGDGGILAGTYDELYTGLVSRKGLVARWVLNEDSRRGRRFNFLEHTTYRADVTLGFEAYLGSLAKKQRGNFKRLLRVFDEDESLEFSFARSAEEALSFFDQLVILHGDRWKEEGELGAFTSPRIIEFHRKLICCLHPRKEILIARLSYQGKPIALAYGFVSSGRFDFYQSGIEMDSSLPVKSPGILIQLLMLRAFPAMSLHMTDFLAGNVDYKRRLSNDEGKLVEALIVRTTPLGVIASFVRILRGGASRLRRFLQG